MDRKPDYEITVSIQTVRHWFDDPDSVEAFEEELEEVLDKARAAIAAGKFTGVQTILITIKP